MSHFIIRTNKLTCSTASKMSRNNGIVVMRFRTADNRVFYFIYYADSSDVEIVFTEAEFRRMTHRRLTSDLAVAKRKAIDMSFEMWCEYLAVCDVNFVNGVFNPNLYWHANPAYNMSATREEFEPLLSDLLDERPREFVDSDSDSDHEQLREDVRRFVDESDIRHRLQQEVNLLIGKLMLLGHSLV